MSTLMDLSVVTKN